MDKYVLGSAAKWFGVLLSASLLDCPASLAASDFCDVDVPVVTPGGASADAAMSAPSDAIVLFDGKDLSQWRGINGDPKWEVRGGVLTVRKGTGDIETKRLFQDVQLHIEWRVPSSVTGEGQLRGNSGVYMQGRYEIQVLDSYHNPTYADGQAGAVYKQAVPLVNAMRKPGEWNVYDIIYTAPRFNDDGAVFSPARVTLLHNGVLIQNNTEIRGGTFTLGPPSYVAHSKGPIRLQDHPDPSEPVSYRNIWVRELGVPQRQTSLATESPKVAQSLLSVDSPLGQLMDNPTARGILSRCVPALVPNPGDLTTFRKITLHQLQPLYGLDETKLRTIDDELASIRGASTRLTVDSPIGELMDNPAAWAVVSQRMPAMAPDPEYASALRKLTLRQLQSLGSGLDDIKLRSISDQLSELRETPTK